jgi:hypothetical protein
MKAIPYKPGVPGKAKIAGAGLSRRFASPDRHPDLGAHSDFGFSTS